MFKLFKLFILVLITSIAAAQQTGPTRILILGDVHDYYEQYLYILLNENYTHSITMGDLNGQSTYSLAPLEKTLFTAFDIQTKDKGMTKENIFFIEGNWEYSESLNVENNEVDKLYEKYGTLVSKNKGRYFAYENPGIIRIGRTKIMASHIPFFEIDEALYQTTKGKRDDLLRNNMRRNLEIPKDISMILFAHTHIPSVSYHKFLGIPMVNSGSIARSVTPKNSQTTYMIYEPENNLVYIHDSETYKVIDKVSVTKNPCRSQMANIFTY